jgi:hypothetical protein
MVWVGAGVSVGVGLDIAVVGVSFGGTHEARKIPVRTNVKIDFLMQVFQVKYRSFTFHRSMR